jgi:5-methylcytosine-specific restriction endonuclease McrA
MGRRARMCRRRALYIEQRGLCAECGEVMLIDVGDVQYLMPLFATIDHIQPLSKGGVDEATNRRLVHKACNEAKADREPDHVPDTQ